MRRRISRSYEISNDLLLEKSSRNNTLFVLFVAAVIVIAAFAAIEYKGTNAATTATSTTGTTSTLRTTSVAAPVDVFNIEKWGASVNSDSYPPDDVVFNFNLSEIYLTGFPSPNITLIDPLTHNANGVLKMPGIVAESIAVDPKSDTVVVWVVTCRISNANASTCPVNDISTTVVEANGRTGQVDHVFPLYPGFFAVDFAAGTLFEVRDCPNPNGTPMNEYYPNCGFLISYDLKSGDLNSNFSLGVEPSSIAVNQANHATVFVTTGSELLLINGSNGQTIEETPLPYETPYSSSPVLAIDPMTNTVFAMYEDSTHTILTAINGTDGRLIYSSPIGSACYVDSNRYFVNPYTDEVYASAYNTQDKTSFFLTIDAETGHLTNMLSTQGHDYVGSAYNPNLNEIYLLLGEGELVSLGAPITQTYVNQSLLADSACSIIPV